MIGHDTTGAPGVALANYTDHGRFLPHVSARVGTAFMHGGIQLLSNRDRRTAGEAARPEVAVTRAFQCLSVLILRIDALALPPDAQNLRLRHGDAAHDAMHEIS